MNKVKINDQIKTDKVRLISDKGEQMGIIKFDDALRQAKKLNMDLVLMSEDAKPLVCKILDYKKHIFEKKKQLGQAKKKHKRTFLKEVKFRPGTEQGDYDVKLRNLIKFLNAGDRAKVTIRFRGREVVYKDRGYDMLKRIEVDLEGIADLEQKTKLEGKLMVTVFKPTLKKKATKPSPDADAKPVPEVKPASDMKPASELKPAPESKPVPESKPASDAKPAPEVKPAPEPEAMPEVKATPEAV